MSDAQCLIRKLTIARRAIELAEKVRAVLLSRKMGVAVAVLLLGAVRCPAQKLTSDALSLAVNHKDGSYEFGPSGGQSVLHAGISALVDHAWLRSGSYPMHLCRHAVR